MNASEDKVTQRHQREGPETLEKTGNSVFGLRASYNIVVLALKHLESVGSSSTESLAKAILAGAGTTSRPNIRRTSGRASAIQATATLLHLGLARRTGDHELGATDLGSEFAKAIGSPAESDAFRRVLAGYPPFVEFWRGLTKQRDRVNRASTIEHAHAVYPQFSRQTALTLAGVCLSYAFRAGLTRKVAGRAGYQVIVPDISQSSRSGERRGVIPTSILDDRADASHPQPARFQAVRQDLHETARLLGWALADETVLQDDRVREQVASAFSAASSSAETGWRELIRLVADLANAAFAREDTEALRWSVKGVNALLHLGQGQQVTRKARSPRRGT